MTPNSKIFKKKIVQMKLKIMIKKNLQFYTFASTDVHDIENNDDPNFGGDIGRASQNAS